METLKIARVSLKEMPYFSEHSRYYDSSDFLIDPGVRSFIDEIKKCDRENFCIFNLDTKGKVLNVSISSIGDLSSCMVSPREALKTAILSNASAIIMMHNHPSGDIEPSRPDQEITERMTMCCNIMGITMADHIIIGNGNPRYFSFKEQDYLDLDLFHSIDYFRNNRDLLQAEPKKEENLNFGFSAGNVTVYFKDEGKTFVFETEDLTMKKRVELSDGSTYLSDFFDIMGKNYIDKYVKRFFDGNGKDNNKSIGIDRISNEFIAVMFNKMEQDSFFLDEKEKSRLGLSCFASYCSEHHITGKSLSKKLGKKVCDIEFINPENEDSVTYIAKPPDTREPASKVAEREPFDGKRPFRRAGPEKETKAVTLKKPGEDLEKQVELKDIASGIEL